MNVNAKIGGRGLGKHDRRSLGNWVGDLKLQATQENEQYYLATLYRLFVGADTPKYFREAIVRFGSQIKKEYLKTEDEGYHISIVQKGEEDG